MRSFLLLFSKYLQPKPFQRVDRDQTLENFYKARTSTKCLKVKQEHNNLFTEVQFTRKTYIFVEGPKKNTYFLSYVASP